MATLHQYKNNEIKNLQTKLKQLNTFLVNAEKTYEHARKNNLISEKRIGEKNIDRYKQNISDIEERITGIQSGDLDDEIQNQLDIETMEREEKEERHMMKLRKKKLNKDNDAKILKQSRDKDRDLNRTNRNMTRDHNRLYNIFEKNSNSLPSYMLKNLKEMPNNKGYIWKDIRFYGYLPAEADKPDVLFEKLRGGVMRIHEINEREHVIFEKKGRERKHVIDRIQRKRKDNNQYSIMDFVK